MANIYKFTFYLSGMIVGAKRGANKSISKGSNNGAVVRKNLEIKEEIKRILKKSDRPMSTSDLVMLTKKAWHTIDRACLMLQIDASIEGFKVGKMNLWRIK